MSNLSQFYSGIKSIQHIAGNSSATATISAVNTDKTVILHKGTSHANNAAIVVIAKFVLANSTQVTVTAGGDATLSYCQWAADVVEYY